MKLVFGILFFISFASHSQETKFVLKKRDGFNEEYYVLASDPKVKEGTYVKYTNIGAFHILESGSYSNGEKSGRWNYFYDPSSFSIRSSRFTTKSNPANSLKESGEFVNGKKNGIWICYYADTVSNNIVAEKEGNRKNDPLGIQIEQNGLRPWMVGQFLNDKRIGEWSAFSYNGDLYQKYDFTRSRLIKDTQFKDSLQYNQSRMPVFLGGMPVLTSYIGDFNYRNFISTFNKDTAAVIVTLSIDKTGKLTGSKVSESSGTKKMEEEALRVASLIPDSWIPALENGEPIAWDYHIAFRILKKRTEDNLLGYIIKCSPFVFKPKE
jgi:TonB family protein